MKNNQLLMEVYYLFIFKKKSMWTQLEITRGKIQSYLLSSISGLSVSDPGTRS